MDTTTHRSAVSATPAADPAEAFAHFSARLAVETDADDVATALRRPDGPDFVLVDVRSSDAYAAGHLPGAINLTRQAMDASSIAALGDGLVVVYCWGPGCNGASKAARELARLGRNVKEMLGGFEYYVREGHPVEGDLVASGIYRREERGLVALPGAVSCAC